MVSSLFRVALCGSCRVHHVLALLRGFGVRINPYGANYSDGNHAELSTGGKDSGGIQRVDDFGSADGRVDVVRDVARSRGVGV